MSSSSKAPIIVPADRRGITTTVAAGVIGCHPRHVRVLIESGRLKGFKIGERQYRTTLHDVQQFMSRPVALKDGGAA